MTKTREISGILAGVDIEGAITATNRVGIGTTSPESALHVNSGSVNTAVTLESADAACWQVMRDPTADIFFGNTGGDYAVFTGGAERMRIDSSGNVGIGTNSPSNPLEVIGNVRIKSASGDTQGLNISSDSNGDAFINAGYSVSDLKFGTNNTERMRIDSSGRLGIGTASPSKAFEASSTSLSTVKINGYTANSGLPMYSYNDSGGCGWATGDADSGSQGYANLIYLRDTDNSFNVYLGQAGAVTHRMKLESDGDLHVDGNVVAYSTTVSDIRLKKDIAPIEDAVTKVQQLNGCTFTYLKDDRKSAGLIAQDVEKVLPSAVIEDEAVFHGDEGETYKTVQYDQVIGLLVEAVKELKAEIEELKNGTAR